MTTNTNPVRVRVLEGAMRMLGCAVAACARRLLNAGVSIPDIALMFLSEGTAEHPDIVTERLLVLQILDQREPQSHAELENALGHIKPLVIRAALYALEAEGVLYVGHELVWASGCTRHLDNLGLIAI
jgi:hypothetical protein